MRSFVTLSVVLFSAFASASAAINISVTKLHRTGTFLRSVSAADRVRAAFLKSRSFSGSDTVPATNTFVQYTTNVGIGNPPTYYNLVVDTGSSNTFCGTGIPYVRTSTSIPTGQNVSVTYGSAEFSGSEYLDQVSLGSNLVITNQSIGDALSSSGFEGVDGIIGVGPVGLTLGSLPAKNKTEIPTVINNLVSQGVIENQVLGVYFQPSTNYNDTNGALTFGGVDPCLYMGEVTYTPVTGTFPASQYWGINVTSSTYGSHKIIPTSTAGIVDTGTTLVLLADDFLNAYVNAIPGAELDENLGVIEIPASSIPHMEPLKFQIADQVFTLTVAAQLFPVNESIALGGDSGKRYGTISSMGSLSGEGLDFILGQKFIERYYTVFDTDANRVGFAETNNTFSTIEG